MTFTLLAVDAGGTSTRAVALDDRANVLGYGRAGSGNPTSNGVDGAVTEVGHAAEQAMAGIAEDTARAAATIAMAGEKTPRFIEQVTARLAPLGWSPVILAPDLLGVFGSGTHLRDGYAVIAGTGSVAARVTGGRLDRVVGGRGWLLGDAGSGFWIGHRVARAVVAALDGQQSPTALTDLVLNSVGVEAALATPKDRSETVRRLVSALYAARPVQLASLAPLAFAAHQDPTARAILVESSQALADLVDAVRLPELPGPVVAGGSVLVRGLLGAPAELRRALKPIAADAELIPVPDGVLGAAVLGLRGAGVTVDEALFDVLRAGLAQVAH